MLNAADEDDVGGSTPAKKRFPVVERGPDFERIAQLPRRPIPDPRSRYALELAEWLTRRLRSVPHPYPLPPGGHIFPTQALAIKEFMERGRLMAPIRVGGGKMLLGYLLALVSGAKRPLYLLPKSMEKETRHEVLRYSADWGRGRLPASRITFISYEKLSNPSSAEKRVPGAAVPLKLGLLQRLRPDFIYADEAHKLGNAGAIAARRLDAYRKECAELGQRCVFVPASGSFFRESLNQAAHIAHWALEDGSPFPHDSWEERMSWAGALDEKQGWSTRTEFGALLELLSDEERRRFDAEHDPDDRRAIVCGSIGQRFLETPGVIGSQDGPLGIPLSIEPEYVAREDPAIEQAVVELIDGDRDAGRPKWSLPDGTLVVDGLALARHRYTFNLGFYQVQDPPPPQDYRDASQAWAKAARDRLKRNKLRIDSEANLKKAVAEGHFKDLAEVLDRWECAQRAYTADTGHREPPSKAVWFSDEAVDEVRRWLEREGTGIVWVGYIPLGQRLSERLGLPYFGAGKLDASGRHVSEMKRGEAVICSIHSCGTGTNLQHFHSKGLWLASPSEQPLGRCHRPGQPDERVQNWVYLPGLAQLERYWKKRSSAADFADPMTKQAQKLVYAAGEMPSVAEAEVDHYGNRRWKPHAKVLDSDE